MPGESPARESKLDEIIHAIEDLRDRVAALERQSIAAPVSPPALPFGDDVLVTPALPPGSVAVFGRALLGLAGAYLLRALAESGSLPAPVGVPLALVYAFAWLYAATRGASPLATSVYGITASLILAPMIWETTVRFQTVTPTASAVALAMFMAFAFWLAWVRNIQVIIWITTIAVLFTTSGLIVATHHLVPFTLALIAIAGAIEYAACRDHWLPLRWLAALVVDCSALLLLYVVTLPRGVPESYAPISRSSVFLILALMVVTYIGSGVYRTILHHSHATWFEIGQAAAVLSIAAGGALQIASSGETRIIAAICAGSGFVSYALALLLFDRQRDQRKNLRTYATFGFLLTIAGALLSLSGFALAFFCCTLAVAAMWYGRRYDRVTLMLHASAFLVVAAWISGLVPYAVHHLVGQSDEHDPIRASVLLTAVAAAACYAITWLTRFGQSETRPGENVCRLVQAAILCCTVVGLTAALLLHTPFAAANPAVVPTIRTALITALAVLLAWAGARWNRRELTLLVYPAMILGGVKLLMEDLRYGRPITMVPSLALYGGVLILLPRRKVLP